MKNKFLLVAVLAVVLCSSCGTVIFENILVDKKTLSFPCEESVDTVKSLDGNDLCLGTVYEEGERVVVKYHLYYPDNESITGIGGEWLEVYEGVNIGLSYYEVVVRAKENIGEKYRKGAIVLYDGTARKRCKIKVTQQGRQ